MFSLDQITSIPHFPPPVENESLADTDCWKRTLWKTMYVPEVQHIRVVSSGIIQRRQEKNDPLCCPSGHMLRSRIAFQVGEAIEDIQCYEKHMNKQMQETATSSP